MINNVEPTMSINARGETEYEWVGVDERGVEIEIVGALVEDDMILVFHVIPTKYRRNR